MIPDRPAFDPDTDCAHNMITDDPADAAAQTWTCTHCPHAETRTT